MLKHFAQSNSVSEIGTNHMRINSKYPAPVKGHFDGIEYVHIFSHSILLGAEGMDQFFLNKSLCLQQLPTLRRGQEDGDKLTALVKIPGLIPREVRDKSDCQLLHYIPDTGRGKAWDCQGHPVTTLPVKHQYQLQGHRTRYGGTTHWSVLLGIPPPHTDQGHRMPPLPNYSAQLLGDPPNHDITRHADTWQCPPPA